MRRKFREIELAITSFLEQRDDLTTVVHCRPGDLPAFAKLLERTASTHADDLFITFAEEFQNPHQYVDAVVRNIVEQLAAANALRAEQLLPEWPAPNHVCIDRRLTPEQRLVAIIEYLHERKPTIDGLLVVSFLPLGIHDALGWVRTMAVFLDASEIMPWMTRLRIFVRDDRDHPALVPGVDHQRPEGVAIFDLDVSTATIARSMAEDVADPAVPKPERMSTLLQLAALDYAHGRFDDAVVKYRIVFEHFVEVDEPLQQALCLEGIGNILRRIGRPQLAKERFQQALVLGARANALMVLLNVLIALGDTCEELRQHDEAARYLELGDQVARRALSPYARCDILERLGAARWALRDFGRAVQSWTQAASLSREIKYASRWLSVEEHLAEAYREAGMDRQRREAESRVVGLRELVRQSRTPGCKQHGEFA